MCWFWVCLPNCRATCWLDFRSQVFEKIQTPHSILSHRKPDHGSVDCCSSWNQMTSGCLRRPYTDTTTSYRNTEGGMVWNFSQIIPGMILSKVPNLASYRSFPYVIIPKVVWNSHTSFLEWYAESQISPVTDHQFPFLRSICCPRLPASLQFVQYSWLMSKPRYGPSPTTHSLI